jgi:hypothetical protein
LLGLTIGQAVLAEVAPEARRARPAPAEKSLGLQRTDASAGTYSTTVMRRDGERLVGRRRGLSKSTLEGAKIATGSGNRWGSLRVRENGAAEEEQRCLKMGIMGYLKKRGNMKWRISF